MLSGSTVTTAWRVLGLRIEDTVTIKNKFAVLENLDDNGDINKAWETIRENIRISAKESIGLSGTGGGLL
jgi:flagellar biosynthesis component FlhA